MAGVIRKGFLSSARLLSRQVLSTSAICVHKVTAPISVTARSLWSGTNTCISRALAGHGTTSLHSHTCCKLHTDVDKELSKLIDKEIQFEESSAKSKSGLPSIQGFEVKGEESEVTLTRKHDNEIITVQFNINGSADTDQMAGEEGTSGQQEEEVQMVSRPAFTVEIQKGSGDTLAFQCAFAALDDLDGDDRGQQEADSIVDQYEIQEVSIHQGEWKETVYTLPAETMDGNLYDLLMDMLDERGINDDFINDLVEFSTAYEHGKYVGFLKNLKSFVEKN